MKLLYPLIAAVALIPGLSSALSAKDLVEISRGLKPEVAQRAVDSMGCAADVADRVDKLIVVDMGMASRAKRLWAFDVSDPLSPQLVLHSRVAHGAGSDRAASGVPNKFSDTPDSHMTSLGLYRVAERYHGRNGISRRLDGLFKGFNTNARARAVVMHPSNYVSEKRVGRSQGCPAVSHETMAALERAGLSNAVLWIDAPDQNLVAAVDECARKREARVAAQKEDLDQVHPEWIGSLAMDFGPVQTYPLPEFDRGSILVEALPASTPGLAVQVDPMHEQRQIDRLLMAIEASARKALADPFEAGFHISPAAMTLDLPFSDPQAFHIPQLLGWPGSA